MKHFWISSILLFTGCASVPPQGGFDEVQSMVADRIAQKVRWQTGSEEDRQIQQNLEELLSRPLLAEDAVQIALFENRQLQAQFEELGISQADLVQAGLLHNPVLFGKVGFPDRPPSLTQLEFSVVQNFLDLFLLSARKKWASDRFQQTKFLVADAVLNLAAQVRAAYFAALGSKQVAQLRRMIVEAAESSKELALRMHEAGNLSELQLSNELGFFEEENVAWRRAEIEARKNKEELARLMGLSDSLAAWALPERLPEIPIEEPDLKNLESTAVGQRFDLAAVKQETEILAGALGVTMDWRYLSSLEIGASAERDTDGQWVVGPEASIELPIFNQGQASIARLEAQFRQSRHRANALAVEIRGQIRSLREQLLSLRKLIEHYRSTIIPLREKIVELNQQEYNYMLIGVFDLIEAKKKEYDSYEHYVHTVRDYWQTRSELEKTLGASLPGEIPPPQEPKEEKKKEDSHHHHGSHGGSL